MQESLLFSVLSQLIVIIGTARIFNTAARRLGQPGAVGEIVAGLALGPSCLGYLFPKLSAALFVRSADIPLSIISQVGLILLMFQIGADFDFSLLRAPTYRRAAGSVALASIAIPLCLGAAFGLASAATLAPSIQTLPYALFCAVAVSITAVPILGRILADFSLTRDPLGVVAISAASINDVTGWLLLACVSAFATSTFSVATLLFRLAAILVGGCILWFVMRPAAARLLLKYPVRQATLSPNLIACVLCLMFAMALCTSKIGIFGIFGGFAAGLLFGQDKDFVEAWNRQVGQFVLVFFLPVFFTFTGLRTNLLGLSNASDFFWVALILLLSVAGKILPVYAAGRLCGFASRQSAILGVLMNTRALMELIVLNIGYNLGVLPAKVFTMFVLMAVSTTIMTGPLLRLLGLKEDADTSTKIAVHL